MNSFQKRSRSWSNLRSSRLQRVACSLIHSRCELWKIILLDLYSCSSLNKYMYICYPNLKKCIVLLHDTLNFTEDRCYSDVELIGMLFLGCLLMEFQKNYSHWKLMTLNMKQVSRPHMLESDDDYSCNPSTSFLPQVSQ